MAGTISGAGLGVYGSSLELLNRESGDPRLGGNGNRVYINSASGNLVIRQQDEYLSSQGLDVGVVRTYNSLGLLNDDNGDNWRLNLNQKLHSLTGTVNTAGSTVTKIFGDGFEAVYTYDAVSGLYISTAGSGAHDTLRYDSTALQWQWDNGDARVTETYDAGLQLIAQQDADGNTTSYVYTGSLVTEIHDASGQITYLDYIGTNLTAIRTVSNTVTQSRVQYVYDTANRLSQVIVDLSPEDGSIVDGHTYTTTYTYDGTSTRVSSINGSDGTHLAFSYDLQGRVETYTDGLGGITRYTYDDLNNKTDVTDPLGHITTYTTDSNGNLIEVNSPVVNGTRSSTFYSYDSDGNVASTTDANGNQTVYTYDQNGNLIQQQDSLGNTVRYVYDAQNRLLNETVYAVPDPDGPAVPSSGQWGTAAAIQTAGVVWTDTRQLAFDAQGNGWALWAQRDTINGDNLHASRYLDGQWQAPVLLEQTLGAISSYPKLIVDSVSGEAHAVWTQNDGTVDRVYTAQTVNGLWQLPIALSTAGKAASQAQLALDTNGQAFAVWTESDGTEYSVYGAGYQGSVWQAPTLLENLTASQAIRPQVVMPAPGEVSVVWQQTNGASYDLYRRDYRLGQWDATPTLVAGGVTEHALRTDQNGQSFIVWTQGNDVMLQRAINGVWQGIETVANGDWPAQLAVDVNAHGDLALAWNQSVGLTEYILVRQFSAGQWGEITQMAAAADGVGDMDWPEVALNDTGELMLQWKQYDSSLAMSVYAAVYQNGQWDPTEKLAQTNDGLYSEALVADASGSGFHSLWVAQADGLYTVTSNTYSLTPAQNVAEAGDPLTIRYVYDSEGHLRFTVSAQGQVSEHRYAANGQRLSSIDYTAAVYDLSLLSATDTLDETQLTTWLSAQDLSQSQRTDYSYDFRGQLAATTTYTGVDALGEGIVDGSEATTAFVYDQAGQLLQRIDPRGVATTTIADDGITYYSYDGLGRLTSTTNALGQATLTHYDDASQRVVTTLANGLTTTSVYDARGLLISQTQVAPDTTVLGTTTYQYDSDGRLRYSDDPLGQRQHYIYDEADRLIMTIDASGALSETVYDAVGNVIKSIAYARTLSDTTLNALVDINGEAVAADLAALRLEAGDATADRISQTIYDRAHRPVLQLKPHDDNPNLAYVSQSFYDGAGRLTDVIDYATAVDISLLPANPIPDDVLISLDALNDRHTRQFYNADGRIIAGLDAAGYLSEYVYDSAGQLIETIQYATALTDSALHTSGELAAIKAQIPATAADRHSHTFYNARGQITAAIDAEGYLNEYRYDLNGNLEEETRYDTVVNYTGVETPEQLRPLSGNTDHTTINSYDALNRIQTITVLPDNTVTQYSYDTAGNLIRTDFAFNTSEVRSLQRQYDLQGHLIAELSAEGSATLDTLFQGAYTQADIDALWQSYSLTHTYDANGRRLSSTDQNGHTSWYYYDANDRLTVTIRAADNGSDLINVGEVTQTTYNAFGQGVDTTQYSNRISTLGLSGGEVADIQAELIALASVNDSTSNINYTLRGAVKQAMDANGYVTSHTYNAFGDNISDFAQHSQPGSAQSDLNSTETTYAYDKRGILTQSAEDSAGLNRIVKIQYDAFGRISQQTDANGNISTFDYSRDGTGRQVVTHTNALNAQTVTAYDAFGRTLSVRDGNGHTSVYSYDDANRSITLTTPEGIQTTTVRNRHGEVVSLTDGNNNVTQYSYDRNGNLKTVTEAVGTAEEVITAAHTYDNANRLIDSTDANGNLSQFTYDAANRSLSRTLDPTGLNITTAYQYDAKGQVISQTDANGIVTQTEYDKRGQVKAVTADPTGLNLRTEYTYDGRGKTLTVIEGAGTLEARTTEYQYDGLGRRSKTIIDPAGLALTTAYHYDSNDNLVARVDASGHTTRYIFDAQNQLTHSVDANGGISKSEYDANGNVIKTTAYATAMDVSALGTTISVTDLVMSGSAGDQTNRFAYDNDGRLRYSIDSIGAVIESVYDNNGNVTQTTAYAEPLTAATLIAIDADAINATTIIADALLLLADTSRDQTQRTYYDHANRAVLSLQVYENAAVSYANLSELSYDANGNVISTLSYATPINLSTAVFADPAQPSEAEIRALLQESAQDQHTLYVYDAANRQRYAVDALGYVSESQYDDLDQLKQTTAYATALNVELVLQAAGIDTTSLTEARMQALLPDALSETTIGSGITALIADDHTSQYHYDSAQRLTEQVYAVGTADSYSEAYAHDALGNVVRHTNGNNDSEYFAYDAAGRQTRHIDDAGYVVDYTHDTNGNIRTQTTWMNAVAQPVTADPLWAYNSPDPVTNLDAVSGDRTTTYTYDANGRLETVTGPSIDSLPGVVTRYVYDSFGQLTDTIEAEGLAEERTTHQVYNLLGQLIETTAAYGTSDAATTRYAYDSFGNQVAIIDPRGIELAETDSDWAKAERLRLGYSELLAGLTALDQDALKALYTSHQEFDPLNRKTAAIDALGGRTQTDYDAFGNIVKTLDPNGNAGYFYYDTLNRNILQIDPAGYVTQLHYDAFANTTETIKYANAVQGTVDENSVLDIVAVAPAVPDGPYLVTDALKDQTTLADYDVLNRTTAITNAEGYSESFQYDAKGNVTQHIDKNNNQFDYAYDKNGNQTHEYLPITSDNGVGVQVQVVNRYVYDVVGNKVQSIEAEGLPEERVTGFVYNKNDYLIETVEPTILNDIRVNDIFPGEFFLVKGDASVVFDALTFDSSPDFKVFVLQMGLVLSDYGAGTFKAIWKTNGQSYTATSAVNAPTQDYPYTDIFNFSFVGTPSDLDNILAAGSSYTLELYNQTTDGDVFIKSYTGEYNWTEYANVPGSAGTYWEESSILNFSDTLVFNDMSLDGQTVRVYYWPESDPNNITIVDSNSYSPGNFSVMLPESTIGGYGYEAKVFDLDGNEVNHVSGIFNDQGVKTIQSEPVIIGQLQTPHTYQSYDANGNLFREIDAKGYPTYHYYDSQNRRIATVDAEGYLHTFGYDAAGNVIAKRTYADRVPATFNLVTLPDPTTLLEMDASQYRETLHRYDANNRLLESRTQAVLTYDRTNGLQNQALVTTQTYDAMGRVTSQSDANGNITYFYYDASGNRHLQVDAAGYVSQWFYDGNGNVIAQYQNASGLSAATLTGLSTNTDPQLLINEVSAGINASDDRLTQYSYDRMGRKISETVVDLSYYEINALTGSLSAATGHATEQYEYDGLGNLKADTRADGAHQDYHYDGLSRLIKEEGVSFTDADGIQVRSVTETVYDGVNNVIQSINKDHALGTDQISHYEYDAYGNLVKETDALGHFVQYYYDLNGNITVKNERKSNPDGTTPIVDTLYSYDKLNRQTSTEDAKNFIEYAEYNAYGDIVSKGLNGVQQEYYEYNLAWRVIKTNQGDGVDKAYLYDANGNVTAKIQSGIIDTDLTVLSHSQIAALDPITHGIQRTESVYDVRNQLVRTYETPVVFEHTDVTVQDTWVDVSNDQFLGGSLSIKNGDESIPVIFDILDFNPNYIAALRMKLPEVSGYGTGTLKAVWTINGQRYTAYPTVNDPTPEFPYTDILSWGDSVSANDVDTMLAVGSTYTIEFFNETTDGDLFIKKITGEYNWARLPNETGGYWEYTSILNIPDTISFTGQPLEAETLDLWLWPQGSTKPAEPIPVPKHTDAADAAIDGWFTQELIGYAPGEYEYEYVVKDAAGVELDTIRGTLTLGDTPTVNTQEQLQQQLLPTAASAVSNLVERAQTYNAFGEVVQEIDGRGYITDFVYDRRGNLIEKRDPETDVTLDNGGIIRQRPVTRYFYDINGQAIGTEDANQFRTTQRYDAAGHLLAEYHPDGGIKTYGYDIFGNRVYQQNELDVRTYYQYDANNQLVRVDRPTDASYGNVARFDEYRYDEAGRRIAFRNANGGWEYTWYDDIGRVDKTVSAAGVETRYRYIYDPVTGGTRTITTLADGRSLEDSTDYFGRLISHKDLGDHTFNYLYNDAGWLVKQTGTTGIDGSIGQDIDYLYYHNGYIKEVIDYGVDRRTRYEYDENGNRTFEGIAQYSTLGGAVYYQWSNIEYDELNRVKAAHDPKYDLSYEYDANGNRRHVYARYHDGFNNEVQTQEYWYAYDAMNRFIVTKGQLVDDLGNPIDVQANPVARGTGTIVAGAEGVAIFYDAASQRRIANNEAYDYNIDGLLTTTKIDGVLRADRHTYDAVGNLKIYYEYDTTGITVTRNVSNTFTADNKVLSQTTDGNTVNYYYDAVGNLDHTYNPQDGANITTSYTYDYWDSAKQQEIKINGVTTNYVSQWQPGFSRFSYDVNGHLTQVSDMEADRHLSYKLNHSGQILQRNELIGTASSRTQYYYYLNDKGVGDAGGFGASQKDYVSLLASREQAAKNTNTTPSGDNFLRVNQTDSSSGSTQTTDTVKYGKRVTSADFDANYRPINDSYPATTPGAYTLRASDIVAGDLVATLRNVALAVWGDASMWYLIQDANGLEANTTLAANQNLVIPNVVSNIHNNASTFEVYNPGERIGNTSPTLPEAPPPPPPPEPECQVIAMIIVIAVTAIVSYYTAGAASSAFGFAQGGFAASAIGAAAGSIAGQLVSKELGLTDDFSWTAVGVAALTAGLTKGASPNASVGNQIVAGAINNITTQGINMLAGVQDEFDWKAVAVAAIAAPITAKISGAGAGTSNSGSYKGFSWEGFSTDVFSGIAAGAIQQSVSRLVYGEGKIDWENIAVNSIGNAIGNGYIAEADQDDRVQQRNDYLDKLKSILNERKIPFKQDSEGDLHYFNIDESGKIVEREAADGSYSKVVERETDKGRRYNELLYVDGSGNETLLGKDFGSPYESSDAAGDPSHSIRRQVQLSGKYSDLSDKYIDPGSGQVDPDVWDDFLSDAKSRGLDMAVISNGLANDYIQAFDNAKSFASARENSVVVNVYNPTYGYKDWMDSVLGNLGQDQTIMYSLEQQISEAINYNGSIETLVVGHSQGAIHTNSAIRNMQSNNVDLSSVDLVNVGSGDLAQVPKELNSYTLINNTYDPIEIALGASHVYDFDVRNDDKSGNSYSWMQSSSVTNVNWLKIDTNFGGNNGNNHSWYLYMNHEAVKDTLGFENYEPHTKPWAERPDFMTN